MAKKRPQVALVYDFDGTLSPGNMQEFGFIQATGKTKEEFWDKNRKLAVGKDANGILTYMYMMLDEAKSPSLQVASPPLASVPGDSIACPPSSCQATSTSTPSSGSPLSIYRIRNPP